MYVAQCDTHAVIKEYNAAVMGVTHNTDTIHYTALSVQDSNENSRENGCDCQLGWLVKSKTILAHFEEQNVLVRGQMSRFK